ncbi:MAG: T9SS type A sorting domain-containing protein [Candidatus Kapaibacterium sp.]
MEIYDFTGGRIAHGATRIPEAGAQYRIVENPRDSSWALIYGGDSGVRVTFLDKQLNVMAADIPASARRASVTNISAAFRGDTLFMIWLDSRTGHKDVYGNYLPIRRRIFSVDEHPAANGMTTVTISPNPARDLVQVDIAAAGNAPIELDIVNPLGQSVRSISLDPSIAADGHVEISTAGIPSGSYFLRYRMGSATGVRSLMIVR